MAEDVQLPIYVLAKDCGEFTEYRSLEDMRGYIEAVDVESNEYDAWDAEGFVVDLMSTNTKRDWLRVERTNAQVSGTRLNEIKSQVVPYVNGRRLKAKG